MSDLSDAYNSQDLPKGPGVYVLRYDDGNVYVGHSVHLRARVQTWARRAEHPTSRWDS